MKKKLIVLSGFVLGLAPVVALAQGLTTTGSGSGTCVTCTGGTLIGLLCRVQQILNAIVPVLIALAVVYFIWGVVSYVISSDEEAKTKGRDKMIMGIIGLAVIVAVWGLVKILTNTFGVDNNTGIQLPTVPLDQGNQ